MEVQEAIYFSAGVLFSAVLLLVLFLTVTK